MLIFLVSATSALLLLACALAFGGHSFLVGLQTFSGWLAAAGGVAALLTAAWRGEKMRVTLLGSLLVLATLLGAMALPESRGLAGAPVLATLVALALLWPIAAVEARRGEVAAAVVLAALAGLGTAVVAVGGLPTWQAAAQEDAWLEWATFWSFLAAALLHGAAAHSRGGFERLLLAGISVFCVVVAGEEISWGQRLFAFQPPEIFLQANYQQELNAHNFLKNRDVFGIPLDSKYALAWVAIAWGWILPLARRVAGVGHASPLLFAPAFSLLVWLSLAYPVRFAGEGAELLFGALAIAAGLVAATAGTEEADAPTAAPMAAFALLIPIGLGIFTAPLVDRLVFGPDPEAIGRTREELNLLRRDLATPGALAPVFGSKDRLHRRIFTSMQKRELRLAPEGHFGGVEAIDPGRRRYVLDPWNAPYWILYQREERVILLYSFGPNRRRDTIFRDLDAESLQSGVTEGDDLAVALRVNLLGR